MDPLEEYLQGPYLTEKSEIKAIDTLINEVWPIFQKFQQENGWPYEIENDVEATVQTPSASTNSMILFAIGQLLGLQNRSVLIPKGNRQFNLPDKGKGIPSRVDLEQTFEDGLKGLVRLASQNWNSSLESHIFDSASFGKNDPFTLTWSLELLSEVDRLSSPASQNWEGLLYFQVNLPTVCEQVINKAFDRNGGGFLEFSADSRSVAVEHSFPFLRAIHLQLALSQRRGESCIFDPSFNTWFSTRVHNQLSLSQIKNGAFDVAELVFSLEGMILTHGDARSVNDDLLSRVFKVIGEAQQSSAYWRPLRPFVTTPQGHALLPISVEIVNSLLRICQYLRSLVVRGGYFSQHLALFRTYSDWLRSRVTRGTGPTVSGKHQFSGWHSEHVNVPGKIHPWETSQVLLFLIHYRGMLAQHIADTLLVKANLDCKWLRREEKNYADLKTLQDYFKKREPLSSVVASAKEDGSPYDVFGSVLRSYLQPRGVVNESGGQLEADCSILLYGPPGTGKSTVAEEMAMALNWELITITPSDFIAHGEAEVEARAKGIFKTLEEQNQKVILLDEIDRLILDRDSTFYHRQADMFQFMTPSMLVKLKDLRRAAASVFIVATNYEERVDPAAKRKGRIDQKLLIAPPDREQRHGILKSELEKHLASRIKISATEPTEAEPNLVVSRIGAKQAAEEVSKTVEFGRVVDNTALMVFGELSLLAATTARSIEQSPNADVQALAKELEKARSRQEGAAIRLTQYRSRFRQSDNFDGSQEPFREFFVLLYLRCEVPPKFSLEESKVINQAFSALTSQDHVQRETVEPLLRECVHNDLICERILKFFPFTS